MLFTYVIFNIILLHYYRHAFIGLGPYACSTNSLPIANGTISPYLLTLAVVFNDSRRISSLCASSATLTRTSSRLMLNVADLWWGRGGGVYKRPVIAGQPKSPRSTGRAVIRQSAVIRSNTASLFQRGQCEPLCIKLNLVIILLCYNMFLGL